MAKRGGYDVLTRPAGGSVIGCVCSDGQVHIFALIRDKPSGGPACGADLEFGRSAKDNEEMCPSCAIGAESWARGGSLYVENKDG